MTSQLPPSEPEPVDEPDPVDLPAAEPMPDPAPQVDPTLEIAAPKYLHELKLHLQAAEPELWQWFTESSMKADDAANSTAEIELLKSAIRLTGGTHTGAAAQAQLLAARLGLDDQIELYQSIDDQSRNARVLHFGGKIHIVFSGDILDLLDDAELRALLLHELAHVVLWRLDDGEYRVLDAMIHRLADESVHQPVAESARRVRLHTEVWADAISLLVLEDLPMIVSALMKVSSGLRHVDPDAYLRQAERILSEDRSVSTAHTHPDNHLRVACLALPTDAPNRDEQIAHLLEGPDDLDTIDLLGQLRLQSLTDQILVGGQQILGDAASGSGVTSYLGWYPSQLDRPSPPADGALSEAQPSVRHLAAALLVDLALTDDSQGGLTELRKLSCEADRLGVAIEFDKILSKATERTVAESRRLREDTAV